MTVGELIRRLQELDENAEARIVYQPNYPLASEISGLGVVNSGEQAGVYIMTAHGGDYAPTMDEEDN